MTRRQGVAWSYRTRAALSDLAARDKRESFRNAIPTKTQRVVLEWEAAEGFAELELQTGLPTLCVRLSIDACKRRGWLDTQGWRTPEGDAALARAK